MARLRLIRRLLRRLGEIGTHRRALVAEAVLWLLMARLTLVVVPFPRLARWLGTFVAPGDPRVAAAVATASQEHTQLAQDVGWAVTRSARYVPFEAVCLPQAIAARVMLKRRGIGSVLHFGASMKGEAPLEAHAWLDAAKVEVTGYPVAKGFAEIGCFV